LKRARSSFEDEGAERRVMARHYTDVPYRKQ